MKKIILLTVCHFLIFSVKAQNNQDFYKIYIRLLDSLNNKTNEECVSDDTVNLRTSGLISTRSYKKLIQNKFSKIVLENDGILNDVSSAGFKIAEDKVKFTFNASSISKNGRVIGSFGISSDIAGNSSVIYSKNKLNTALFFTGRLSFLTKSKLYYSCTAKEVLLQSRKSILEYAGLALQNDSLRKLYADKYLSNVITDLNKTYQAAPTNHYNEAVSNKIKALEEDKDRWAKYITEHPGPKKLYNSMLDSLYSLETKSEPWNAINLQWFSINVSLQPSKYNIYYQIPNILIPDSAFYGFKVVADYNWFIDYTDKFYKYHPTGGIKRAIRYMHIYARYHGVRFEINRTNNTMFYDTAQVTGKDGSKVKAVKYFNDSSYSKLYEFTISNKNFFYFGSNKSWGIEITPRYTFRQKGYYNSFDFDAGLLFQFKDRDKETAKVNFEFLFSFRDISKNYKNNFPVAPDKFIISFVGGIPLATIFRGLY